MALREREWVSVSIIFLLLTLAVSSAVTLEYNEGELVKLAPEAEDIDGDPIKFVYSSPLNQSGEWQTTYDDAGTHVTTVSAFDGKDYTEEEVIIVVHNVNRASELAVKDVTAVEGELVDVQPKVHDLDNDDITLTFSSPLDNNGRWQTGFDDAGRYDITVTAHDGEAQVEEVFTLIIENKNRAPTIIAAFPDGDKQRMRENEELSFLAEARDPDGDVLRYTWFVDDKEAVDGDEFTYITDYDGAGTYTVSVMVSDGNETVREEWSVEVQNVNRAPSLQLEAVRINEGELFALELPEKDVDGDKLSYTIDEPVGNDGKWQTSFEDAGVHTIEVVASDGELSERKTIAITVIDVDRAPEFAGLEDVTLNENEELDVLFSVADPDGDALRFSAEGLEGAVVGDFELTWNVGYDFIQLPKHFFARLLSRLRVDHFVYKPRRTMEVLVSACGKEKCSNQSFAVVVQNVNREPVMERLENVVVREGDEVVLEPKASDPDNDYIKFSFSEPFGFGKWKPDFEDAGVYPVTVTAHDGETGIEQNLTVTVENINRVPEFGRLADAFVRENETLSFVVPVSDPDGDNLTLIAENLPVGAAFSDGVFSWTPDYDVAQEEFLVTFGAIDNAVSNESVIVKKTAMITVQDANRAPVIRAITPNATSIALAGQPVVFKVNAFDPDGDDLKYTMKFGFFDRVQGHSAVKRRFSSVGEQEVTVVVSDGKDAVEQTWKLRVGRLRRKS